MKSNPLPDNRSCKDCAHFDKCRVEKNCTGDEKVCQWQPQRYMFWVGNYAIAAPIEIQID